MDVFQLLANYAPLLETPRRERTIKRRVQLDDYDDHDFKRRFRLSKRTVLFIHDLIEERIRPASERNDAIDSVTRLLMTLRWYATGSFLLVVADFSGVSEASACNITWQVTKAIARLRSRFIQLPLSEAEQDAVRTGFYSIAGFPRVVGTIDCTHIKIQSPGGADAEYYRNRKGWFSYNVQTLSDHQLKIRDVVARWPGSSHDSTILQHSNLLAQIEANVFRSGVILGDGGYACTTKLLTPLLNPTTVGEVRYNEAHIATRNTVERQYGLWKRRLPILRNGITISKSRIQALIVACAVIHNIAIDCNDDADYESSESDHDEGEIGDGNPGPDVSTLVRDTLISWFEQN